MRERVRPERAASVKHLRKLAILLFSLCWLTPTFAKDAKLIEPAEKDGKLIVYGTMQSEIFELLQKSFQKKTGIAARRSYAVKNRDVIVRVIKATMEGVKVIFTQEALAKKILSKYTRQTQPEILDKLHKFATETIPRDPTIPRDAILNMARLMGDFGIADRAAVNSTPPDAFFDNSYVDEIKQSGVLRELWR